MRKMQFCRIFFDLQKIFFKFFLRISSGSRWVLSAPEEKIQKFVDTTDKKKTFFKKFLKKNLLTLWITTKKNLVKSNKITFFEVHRGGQFLTSPIWEGTYRQDGRIHRRFQCIS